MGIHINYPSTKEKRLPQRDSQEAR